MKGTALVTFLGRARLDPQTGYRTARYRFPDGTVRETPFFALALKEHLEPDAMVILGTPGSMWDVLIEHLARTFPERYEDQRLALAEAASRGEVGPEHLEALAPLAREALGIPCDPVLIAYGRTLEEQIALLDDLHEAVGDASAVHLDITHGLRHLSMLALVAAHFLEALSRSLSVEQIWYGALELQEEGVAPVIGLGGLMRLQRWTEALRRFEDDGDYGIFADLLEEEGVERARADLLRQASFFEGVLNLPEARRRLLSFLPLLDDPLPGAGRLFGKRLKERLDWVGREDLYQHQRRLAFLHLGKGDFLRAAILADEAVLTRWMRERGEGDVNRYRDREKARKAFLKEMGEARRDALSMDFQTLELIRNALAHGTAPEVRRIRELLQNPNRLRSELERLLSRLLT